MARKISKETVQLWRERVARQAASGVTIRQFCDQEGISQATFYAWRRRFRDRTIPPAKPVTTRRRPSGGIAAESSRTGDFIPLKLLDAPAAWEVVHPRGYRVRVSGEVSATTLQCIMGVFDGGMHE
jgi:hypothetical protein